MLGGSDPKIANQLPRDIEVRRNTITRPTAWKTGAIHWEVKNLFEVKHGIRWLVDGNTFANNWTDAQDGYGILLRSMNQDGGETWSISTDITFTNNTITSENGINLNGLDPYHPANQMARLLISNNVWNVTGTWLKASDFINCTFDHNTINNGYSVTNLYAGLKPNMPGVRYTFNIANRSGGYGIFGDAVGEGTPALTTYWPQAALASNVLTGCANTGGQCNGYPSGFYSSASSVPGVGADTQAITAAQNRP